MTADMRLALIAGVTSLFAVLTVVACSSSPPAAEDPDAGVTAPPRDDDPVDDPPPGSSSGEPDTDPKDAGAKDAEDDAPPTTTGDAGAECDPTSIRESEANNDDGTADPLPWKTTSYCGRLAGKDVDVVTFTIPSSQKGFQFGMKRTLSGAYSIQCKVDGKTFTFDGKYPYEVGEPYFCTISLTGKDPVDYRLDLTVTPN